jgi:threonine aldolase
MEMTELLRGVLAARGFRFYIDSPTNQQFILIENSRLEKLTKEVVLTLWEKPDAEHSVVRFAADPSTTPEDIEALDAILAGL